MQDCCTSVKLAKVTNGSKEINKKPARVRLNEAINAPELRVIDAEGKQVGVMSKSEALAQAHAAGLDLVEISPDAKPPVVKIIDWGKYSYQKAKQEKKNRQKNKTADLKQMRLGLKIGDHDLDIKLRKTRKFLEAGHSVRFVVRYRGREMAHRELGFKLLERVAEALSDIAVVEQEPKMAGRQLSMTMRFASNAKAKNTSRDKEANPQD